MSYYVAVFENFEHSSYDPLKQGGLNFSKRTFIENLLLSRYGIRFLVRILSFFVINNISCNFVYCKAICTDR